MSRSFSPPITPTPPSPMPRKTTTTPAYALAREAYAAHDIDTEKAIRRLTDVAISLHCWQADDVHGLEAATDASASGGIMATGNYPGRARNGDEMRADLDLVLKLLPGKHRLNLHALYAETAGKRVDRDALAPEHFTQWLAWAKRAKIGLDFNPTYFAHPKAAGGYTLSSPDKSIRQFWIEHGRASRRIAQAFSEKLGTPCVNNHWIPDGAKDAPSDRWSPRSRLRSSLDAIFNEDEIDSRHCIDAVEGKLFGLGAEDYTVGSHEFYYSYAQKNGLVPCLDLGHYHPTESIADKVSALMQFHPRLLLHTSRPMRWDSDHVVILNDDVRSLFSEIVRGDALERVFIALDFFDASINRLAAYVIGARATRQAVLCALLDPVSSAEKKNGPLSGHARLALGEEAKSLPWGAVWDEFCHREDVPLGSAWLAEIASYENAVLNNRR